MTFLEFIKNLDNLGKNYTFPRLINNRPPIGYQFYTNAQIEKLERVVKTTSLI